MSKRGISCLNEPKDVEYEVLHGILRGGFCRVTRFSFLIFESRRRSHLDGFGIALGANQLLESKNTGVPQGLDENSQAF